MALKKPEIMGILNVTPDSFYDGGRCISKKMLSARIKQLIKEKADIIDVGGESTRPYSSRVSIETEIKRVIPAIKEIRKLNKKIPVSIDTSKPAVAGAALDMGANIVNDITGLKNPEMIKVSKKYNCPVVIMHMRGNPQTMQKLTEYENILKEIYGFFEQKIRQCLKAGIFRKNIIIDPGIGFAKTKEQNLFLLKNLHHFKKLKTPILIGVSRKSFIGLTLNEKNPKNRLFGSLASAVYGWQKGAGILRVHDVGATRQAVDMIYAIENTKL